MSYYDLHKEQIEYDDYHGNIRPTMQPFKCSNCGKIFHTAEVYNRHKETCTKQQTKQTVKPKPFKKLEHDLRKNRS